ncbi:MULTISPECIES: DUF1707 SHOCT-like domain-containing protein [Rhodococcus]|uniref:DUF1707 domain-containing protein n=2 Tax=Rhodococcus TaxID=1827 RepID=A0AAW4XFP2_RHORH|nr:MULTISPECIES: DUF1707 domain-containing protein [Rhodococcus]KLL97064.1 hypothetical protein NJ76_09915 [Rhodococcus sp. IITR03]KSZ60200.1 hypothetical protein Z045_01660 [Rhodococcus pyridinivorans KG-16]MCD2111831.1 DUF1707 domain-containing protein [Rhodococcus rhodochrous]QHG82106.1 DUF1707 domain-containing protein [Rhodococcus rhodochrous]QOH58220.1 DUF1707 domain-containing protein [Rhodococcus rhodochrous]
MEPKDLRVSDAEREHVGELLQRAVGQGMLSLGEFTERMDTVLAAKTRGDLNQVLVDLPGIQIRPEFQEQNLPGMSQAHYPAPSAAGYPAPSAAAFPATGQGAPLVIKGRVSGIERKGRWHVPPTIVLDTVASSVTLDFTEAVMQTQVVRIDVSDYLSSINIVLPAEATADVNGVENVASSVSSKVRGGAPYGPLHVVVTGKVRGGSFNVTHPLSTRLRKFFNGS